MVEPSNTHLSITTQCQLLSSSRAGWYYEPKGESPLTLTLMRLIDEQFLATPYDGSRQMARWLRRQGYDVGRHRVPRLMALMGLHAIYQEPRTSQPHPHHLIYPSLLRNLAITRANHVWCPDISSIPIKRGFLYLVAIMDWSSRNVLAWRLSTTMETSFCMEALEEALALYGKPDIFHTDQGAQLPSQEFTAVLKDHESKISMDGKGRWMENVCIERLWRNLKYECVYLHAFDNGAQARTHIGTWLSHDNQTRPHSTFDGQTPDEVYHRSPLQRPAPKEKKPAA